MISMSELREAHLRYLLAIYESSRTNSDVGTQDVAKTLNCSKASVIKMTANLMDMNLLVRERYGKIYLTDTGFLLAKDLLRCVELIREQIPAIGFVLTEEETEEYIRMMAINLPEHCRKRLAECDIVMVAGLGKSLMRASVFFWLICIGNGLPIR